MIGDDETLCCLKPSSFVYFNQPILLSLESLRFNKSLEDKLIGMIPQPRPSLARFVLNCRTLVD